MGPYTHVEVGFPSHPFPEALVYKEDPLVPDEDTIFAYVPVEIVLGWIFKHGGIAPTMDMIGMHVSTDSDGTDVIIGLPDDKKN